jgi:hypothetical protein
VDGCEISWESHFPLSVIQTMPPCMNNALAALNSNSIHCSFCADTLLDFIGGLAKDNCSISNYRRHDSEESFISECIEVVCCMLIMEHGENPL